MFDCGIHYIHNVRKVLELSLPDSVSAIGGITRKFTIDNPDHLDVKYEFDGLPLYWSRKEWGFTSPIPDTNIGIFYYGEKRRFLEEILDGKCIQLTGLKK